MGDDITVRQFSKTDLLAIAGLQDRWLATIFANRKTYSAEEIAVLNQIRSHIKHYAALAGGQAVWINATDDDMARRFMNEQYTSWKNLTERIVNYRRVTHAGKRVTTKEIAAARKEWGRQGAAARWKQKGQEHG